MIKKTWYRHYRPRKVKNLHLKQVRKALLEMMSHASFPQALLFSGPKGTGKTSASRIIGVLLNDESNSKLVDHVFFGAEAPKKMAFVEPNIENDFANRVFGGNSFVVQEMDAASNRGIDDIRALKERAMLPPQEGKISVYILDEAHMLTTEAFNALLKLLEEPPPHAVFVLATTEAHKIPPTITSRCTQIMFSKASIEEIVDSLKTVLDQEKIEFDPGALEVIAQRADGSFRDAVKILEFVVQGEKKLSQELVDDKLGNWGVDQIVGLVEAVISKNEIEVISIIQQLRQDQVDQMFFYKTLMSYLHDCLLIEYGVKKGVAKINGAIAQFMLNELLGVDLLISTPISFLSLELKLLDIILRAKKRNGGGNGGNSGKSDGSKSDKNESEKNKEDKTVPQKADQADVLQPAAHTNPASSKQLLGSWPEFVKLVGDHNSSLAALLKSGNPQAGENGLAKIGVYYKFHQEQLKQPKHLKLMYDCCEKLLGGTVEFEFYLAKQPVKSEVIEPENKEELSAIVEQVLM